MKTIKKIIFLFLVMISLFTLTSCNTEPGTSELLISGDESRLPPEIKGLKIYSVTTKYGDVKVGVVNNQVVSTQYDYRSGKITHSEDFVLVKGSDKIIKVSSILMENDSLIVFKK